MASMSLLLAPVFYIHLRVLCVVLRVICDPFLIFIVQCAWNTLLF